MWLIKTLLVGMVVSVQAVSLDTLGVKWETDKSSISHNYLPIYEKYFQPLQHQVIHFLEIGFCKGQSARMWEEYFSNARLYFIDNNFAEKADGSRLCPRSSLHIMDQADAKALTKFAQESRVQFDVILDDGGHTMQQQITSFITLFPYLKSGGLYCIEDLHTSYWPKFHIFIPGQSTTTVQFLQHLIDELNYIGYMTSVADKEKVSPSLKAQCNEYQWHIESIHFYTSLCIIQKR